MERPDTVTVLLFATAFDPKAPVAELVTMLTLSPAITPSRPAEPSPNVAVSPRSYSLFAAVMFVAVNCLAVMLAVVV